MKYLGPPQSGSLAAVVYSRNQFGQYTRPRTNPTQSAGADYYRLAMTTGNSQWQSITDAQRLSWEQWARENPTTDSLGNRITLTGQQAFLKTWIIDQAIWAPTNDPPWTPPVWGLTGFSATCASSVLTMLWNGANTAQAIAFYTSAPCGLGAMRPTSGSTRYLFAEAVIGANTSPYDVSALYLARFGVSPPPAGKVLFIECREYSNHRTRVVGLARVVTT